jgi:hypothetical protein
MPMYVNVFKIFFQNNRLFYSRDQGRTGQRSNATLVARAFKISHTKCQKRGLLETFWGSFEFLCMDGRWSQRSLLGMQT